MSAELDYDQQHLVKMANQIAANVPLRNDIPGQVANHIRTFWTPVMRTDLTAIAREHPDALAAQVHDALDQLHAVEA
ncbi:MAG TPA: formate dehydrogenase subunit delta [Candidatus Nanopelagicales bacterium]|nr:formate dehydrogenase subunit delta [Candidatus Nanopelagicales bacterium]